MSLRLYAGPDAIAALESEWRALETDTAVQPFQKWAFASAWAQTIGRDEHDVPLVVALEDPQGVSALFPASLARFGAVSMLTWLGGPLLADYGDVLHHPQRASIPVGEFVAGALSMLRRRAPLAPLYLPNVRADAACADALSSSLSVLKRYAAPYVRIEGCLADHLHSLSRDKRKGFERRRRRFAETGEIRFDMLTPADAEFDSTFEWLFARQAERFDPGSGLGHRLFTPAAKRFYPTWARLEPGVFIARLTLDGSLIAADLRCTTAGTVLGVLTAFDPARAEFSPGMQLDGLMLDAAHDMGLSTIDLGPGEGAHKAFWSHDATPITAYVSRGLSGRMLLSAARVRRRLRGESTESLASW